MRLYQWFWKTHKWTGIVAALLLLNLAGTGFLLLLKKRHDWIQPPTRTGAAGDLEDFLTLQQVLGAVLELGHEDFRTLEDVDRVDFRPGRRVHKVRSVHRHTEIQVDAVSGAILSVEQRLSDLLEDVHDGSFFAGWIHAWLMPLVPLALSFLVGSGLYLWLAPWWRRRRRARAS